MISKLKLLTLILFILSTQIEAQDIGEIGKGKVFDIHGSLGVGSTFTNQQGITARRVPFSWYINGSPTLQFYNIQIPFSFVWSEQERNFSQPFNKYGASPYYKWLTVHAGWRNLYFSDYTLAGATFLGGGIELKPGRFRFSALYGKFRNKVTVDQGNQSRFSYLLPSYERWGMGFKIGFGKGANYTDLILFKATDKKDASLAKIADSAGVKPMENIAVGIKSTCLLFKTINFNLDFALSAVTLDSRYDDSSVKELSALKPYAKYLTINRSTVPYLAGNTSISYSQKTFRVKLEYLRVDPEYQSLGSYYIANDISQITIAPTFMLFKNKLIFNGSLGIRNNNLLKDQLNTTINRIGSAFINFNPRPHYGFNLNYTNYGTELNSGQRQLNDSIMFSIINQSIGGGFRYAKTKGGRTISFALNAQTQNLQDNNILTRANTESSTMVLSTSLNIGNGKIGTNGGATLNYTKVNTRLGTFQLVGPSINVRKSFKKTKLNLSANASFQQKIKENKSDGNITNIGLTTNYTLKKKHNFSLMLNALFNRTTNISIYTFNEQRLSAQYTFTL
jgi:hypothetical protein